MFDDLRAQASENLFEDEGEVKDAYSFRTDLAPRPRGPFLGMTAPQRLVVAVMLFMMTCILSTFCLLVMGKISLPFLS
jgi:hypothetical protein